MTETINCLDLKGQHAQIKDEIFEAFEKVYAKTAFSGGPFVQEFEDNFAKFIGSKYAIGVSSGTTALHLSMLALGIGPGDEVIMPANTFIATPWGPSHAGATPVFVDCNAKTWQIDASKIEDAITSKTKAIIGVHLYGQPFDIDAVNEICDRHNLFLIEDAAQAHGAKYKGTTVGTYGEMACYSFYPGKNLGACGEGGGITTNSEKIKDHLHSLRNHGCKVRYYHDEIGFNYRMGGLEGVSLNVKLKYIEGWNQKRQEIAKRYLTEIDNPKIQMQYQPDWAESVYHLFVVIPDNKNDFENHLKRSGINPAYHYPVPCHLQKAYENLGYKKGDFPNAEYLAEKCISLPMYAELSNKNINKVIEVINQY
ncbi:DegT/DnrJ/EryC1/StrS family aminotransferase [Bacteroidota bacterium]|nr:DegT/DnrJ/EryC1/StrS family aminotransferase [Bacteroidota bacterium]